MLLVIWASHVYLTRAFSEDQNADATVRATLYGGSIQSTIQRHSVVPLLLSRDPILILALRSGQYTGAEERLKTFKEEIGAGSIFLLDADGTDRRRQRRAPARAVRRRQGLLHRGQGRDRHGLLDHRERRRRIQLPLRPPDRAGGRAARRGGRHRAPRRARGGLAAGEGQGGGDRQRGPGAARLRARLASEDAVEHRRPRVGPLAGRTGDPRCAAEHRRALLRLSRGHAAPADRGAGRLPQLAPHLLRDARGRARTGERDPVAHHHGAGAAARACLLPPVAADARGEPAHPARIRGAPRAEPAALGGDRRAKTRREGTSRKPSKASSRRPSWPRSARCRPPSATS